jgi:4Fe-4S ferredoxin
MKRGTTVKRIDLDTLTLERKMITRSHVLKLDRKRCVGCDLCAAVCPREAIELKPAVVEAGRLVQRTMVDIDSAKCQFCGECVVVCPVNALSMLVDGEARVPVLEYEAFPTLTKQISVNVAHLPTSAAEAAERCCPTEVIAVELRRDPAGKPAAVQGVSVDESNCIYCKQCEIVSPETFHVTHPFEGLIHLETSLCPAGCQACADICPSHALAQIDGKLTLDDRVCLYCGACTRVCPVPEALRVSRHRVRHSPIKSGAWVAALEKLVSAQETAEELALKSQAKRRSVLSFLPGAPKKA